MVEFVSIVFIVVWLGYMMGYVLFGNLEESVFVFKIYNLRKYLLIEYFI